MKSKSSRAKERVHPEDARERSKVFVHENYGDALSGPDWDIPEGKRNVSHVRKSNTSVPSVNYHRYAFVMKAPAHTPNPPPHYY